MFKPKAQVHLSIAIALTASLLSCAAPNPSTIALNNAPSLTSQITAPPQAAFERSGSIKGQIRLPGLLKPTQIATNSDSEFGLLAYFTGMAAHAQEAEEESGDTVDLTEEDVENLQATVDGEAVDLTITNVESDEETGETVIDYEIEEAPASDGNEVLEIQTEEGTTILGAITNVEEGETTEQTVDTETTSILATAEEIHGSLKIKDLTEEDLSTLALDPAVLNMNASLRSILKKDGSLKTNKARLFGVDDSGCGEEPEMEEAEAETGDFETQSNGKSQGKGKGLNKSSSAEDEEEAPCPTEDPDEADEADEA